MTDPKDPVEREAESFEAAKGGPIREAPPVSQAELLTKGDPLRLKVDVEEPFLIGVTFGLGLALAAAVVWIAAYFIVSSIEQHQAEKALKGAQGAPTYYPR